MALRETTDQAETSTSKDYLYSVNVIVRVKIGFKTKKYASRIIYRDRHTLCLGLIKVTSSMPSIINSVGNSGVRARSSWQRCNT